MSINKGRKDYVLQCDFCSNYVDELINFQDAVDYKKANG